MLQKQMLLSLIFISVLLRTLSWLSLLLSRLLTLLMLQLLRVSLLLPLMLSA